MCERRGPQLAVCPTVTAGRTEPQFLHEHPEPTVVPPLSRHWDLQEGEYRLGTLVQETAVSVPRTKRGLWHQLRVSGQAAPR